MSSVLTLFRHALIALGENPPHAKPKVLEHAAEVFGFDAQPLRSVLELRSDATHRRHVHELTTPTWMRLAVAHELDVESRNAHWQKRRSCVNAKLEFW